MIQYLKKKAAKIWAQSLQKKEEKNSQNAIESQEKICLSLIKTAEKTLFGRAHQFNEIKTVKEFQKNVPIVGYEELRPYIEKMKKGQRNILWPETPLYFAKTSGTTSGSKYIPISKEGMPYHIQGAKGALLHYIHKKGNANFLNGKMIFIQGNPILEELFGIKTGRLSGIVAHHIPNYLQKNRLPSWETNTIEDWETKINHIVLETEKENMTVISGIPPWLIMYFEKLIERNHIKITELFPNLQLIITGGVNYEPYREKIEQLLGKKIDIIQTFPASEGFFAYQDDFSKEGLLLLTNHGIFYEFIPLEEYGKPQAKRLTLEEIELHKDYALILTTNSGLWAYSIGDVVRFIEKNPYKIIVSGRTKHYTSAFGEHVIAIEVEEAMKATIAKFRAEISEFHLAPEVNPKAGLPYHEWLIEFSKTPENLEEFRLELDVQLRKRNPYYDDLITGKVLQPLVISPLKKNAFIEFAKSEGKLGGQNKLPRLSNDRKTAEKLEIYKLN